MKKKDTLLLLAVLTLAVLSRWIPHPPNFSPIGALALFSGVFFADRRLAFLIPFSAMFVSDLLLGLSPISAFVYLGFAITIGLGIWLRSHLKARHVILSVLGSSVIFFILTNFGVWAISGLYPHTFSGLTACYIAAIPFFQNSLLGDLFYNLIFMGGYLALHRQSNIRHSISNP